MMPLAQNSREGEQGRLSPLDEEEEEDEELTEVESSDASPAENAASMPVFPSPCLLYTSPSPRDATLSRMPSSA